VQDFSQKSGKVPSLVFERLVNTSIDIFRTYLACCLFFLPLPLVSCSPVDRAVLGMSRKPPVWDRVGLDIWVFQSAYA